VVVKEAMPGIGVPMELIRLAIFLQFGFVEGDLFEGGIAVFFAEQAEQGTGEVFGVINGSDGLFVVEI
jgi:hypothetical protein